MYKGEMFTALFTASGKIFEEYKDKPVMLALPAIGNTGVCYYPITEVYRINPSGTVVLTNLNSKFNNDPDYCIKRPSAEYATTMTYADIKEIIEEDKLIKDNSYVEADIYTTDSKGMLIKHEYAIQDIIYNHTEFLIVIQIRVIE